MTMMAMPKGGETVLWVACAVAVLAAGIGPFASWVKTTRLSRGLLAALGLCVFLLVIGDVCGLMGVPDWLCLVF